MAEDSPVLTISQNDRTPVSDVIGSALINAYEKLGYQIQFANVPAARANIEASQGRLDGLNMRVELDLANYQDLVQVPAKLFDAKLVLVVDTSKCNVCDIHGVAELATFKGFLGLQYYLDKHRLDTKIKKFKSSAQLIRLMEMERIPAIAILEFMLPAKFKSANSKWHVQTLTSFPVYHYINRRHQNLIDDLAPLIKQYIRPNYLANLGLTH